MANFAIMKSLRMSSVPIAAIFIAFYFLSTASQAQTLGEVLRAVQNREQLLCDNESAVAALGGTGTSRALINWGVVPSYPTDAQVDALSVTAKLGLMQQAKKAVDILYGSNIPASANGDAAHSIYFRDKRMLGDGVGILQRVSDHEYEERISLFNYNESLSILAQRTLRLAALDWPVQWNSFQEVPNPGGETIDQGAYSGITDSFGYLGFWLDAGFYIGTSTLEDKPTSTAAANSSGDINIFSRFNYYITAITGSGPYSDRGDALYDPSNQIWSSIKNAPQSIVQLPHIVFSPGEKVINYLVTNTGADQLQFRGQLSEIGPFDGVLGFDAEGKQNGDDWLFLEDGLTFTGVYYPHLGSEFASSVVAGTANALPEPTERLRITPKLEDGELEVQLGGDPVDECALTWSFPTTIGQSAYDTAGTVTSYHEGALSSHKCLTVKGCGNWDAVYSGRDSDREPQIEWPDPGWPENQTGLEKPIGGPFERWGSLSSYIADWWRPVLVQLVTAQYGVNITQYDPQSGPAYYSVDFYRKDQVGVKTNGRYTFSGTPIETLTVKNPVLNTTLPADSQPGDVEIDAASGAKYLVHMDTTDTHYGYGFGDPTASLYQYPNGCADSHFTYTMTIGPSVLVSKDVTVTGARLTVINNEVVMDPTIPNNAYTVVDKTSIDGQALPTVTSTYRDYWANPLKVLEVDEVDKAGGDGIRSTKYSYAWVNDAHGNPQIDHLIGISQSGGLNPYVAQYDQNEQLTDYVCGASEVAFAYSGNSVTRTDKQSGTVVRTLVTTYSPDMTTRTTTSSVPGTLPSVVQFYPGTDGTNPWGLKSESGFDGSLQTYNYAWSGSDFVTTAASGWPSTATPNTVAAGTSVETKVNWFGKVFSTKITDIESGALMDYATVDPNAPANGYQSGTPYPAVFNCPLNRSMGFGYDSEGQIVSETDRLGVTTTLTLDALGRTAQAVRGPVTANISYDPGYLGRFITFSSAGETNRTRMEQTSPFGASQSLMISGPENISVSRIETASSVTTQVLDSTTEQTRYETIDKNTLATSITGNANEPWNIAYAFPGSGWQATATDGNDASITASSTYDELGRVTLQRSPNPNGSGAVASVAYTYTNGRLSAAADAEGTTQYTYQPDGSLQQIARGGRFVSVNRFVSTTSQIGWQWQDATGDVLWQQIYNPQTQVIQDYPRGKTARMITTTPQITGSLFSYTSTGPNFSGSAAWSDGVPYNGTFTSGAAASSWNASANGFEEVKSLSVLPGQVAANAETIGYSGLGLPTQASGLVNEAFVNNFDLTNGWLSSATRNYHVKSQSVSTKGDLLGITGYGVPDATWSAPVEAGSINRSLTTGAGSAQFTWSPGGELIERSFPDGSSETYAYDGAGAVASKATPRANFAFSPNAFGQPTQIGSMATLGYDLAGRINAVTDAAGTHTQSYIDGQRSAESHTSGVLHGQSVTRSYDALGRLQMVKLPGGKSMSYTYDTSGALSGVTTAGGATGTWSNFSPVTGQAGDLILGQQATSTTYDGLGRVIGHGAFAADVVYGYTYSYDADGHCSGSTTPNGNWTYVYDANGWLHSATAPGWKSFAYNFDEAGRPAGAVDYRPMVRLNNAVAEVMGSVTPGATLKINGTQEPVSAGGVFDVSFTGLPAGWQTFTVQGSLANAGANGSAASAADTFHVYVPPPSESVGYDASGNRASDSHWAESWNGLDQLTTIIESSPYSTATLTRLDCIYDVSGRRVQKQVSVGGQVTKRTTTLWDGWLPMMEVDYGASGLESARRYYTWGPDASGSLDGAAGIGGLVEIYEIKPTAATRSLPIYDGIGNVVGLVDESTGQSVATYQYGPFGEVIGVYGPRAESCPLRFQTKLYDEETGFYYFGKRYYDPKTQTWLSRDPERESGGINLYAYCGNDPVGNYDPTGLAMFGLYDSYSEYFSEVGKTYANIGLGAYQAVQGVGLGTIQLIDQTPDNLLKIGSSLEEMSQDPKLYLGAAYDLLKESALDVEQGLLSVGEQTEDLWTSGDPERQGLFLGGVLGNAAMLALPGAELPAVGDIFATVKAAYTGDSWLSSETAALNPSGHLFRALGSQAIAGFKEMETLDVAKGGAGVISNPGANGFVLVGDGSLESASVVRRGEFVNRVYDSSYGTVPNVSGPLGRSFSPGSGIPTTAAETIQDRGLMIYNTNNAQQAVIYQATKNIPAILRTSLGGTAPELLIDPMYFNWLNPRAQYPIVQ